MSCLEQQIDYQSDNSRDEVPVVLRQQFPDVTNFQIVCSFSKAAYINSQNFKEQVIIYEGNQLPDIEKVVDVSDVQLPPSQQAIDRDIFLNANTIQVLSSLPPLMSPCIYVCATEVKSAANLTNQYVPMKM